MTEDALSLWMHRRKYKTTDRIEALKKKKNASDEMLANIGY